MNPTAEDILNSPFRKFILEKEFNGLTEKEAEIAIGILPPETFIKYAEEYSLLKSKEAADKAWEVACKNYRMGKTPTDELKKETFMKELFKDHG